MTSDDTHDKTVKLLSNFYNFGMKPIYEKKFFNLLVINKFEKNIYFIKDA